MEARTMEVVHVQAEAGQSNVAIREALAAPFQLSEIKFKPQTVKANRALAAAYVDARVVEDRLDEAVGPENWQDSYELLPDGSAVCRLAVRFGAEWITKTDVGSPSEQPDAGDRVKAAFSDGLKRAAVKFGVGRYLYRLPAVWCDYDPQKRQFVKYPALPAWALPQNQPAPAIAQGRREAAPTQQQRAANAPPTTTAEFVTRLMKMDAQLAAEKRIVAGFLLSEVKRVAVKNGLTKESVGDVPDAGVADLNLIARQCIEYINGQHKQGRVLGAAAASPPFVATILALANEVKESLNCTLDYWLRNVGGGRTAADLNKLSAADGEALLAKLKDDIENGVPFEDV